MDSTMQHAAGLTVQKILIFSPVCAEETFEGNRCWCFNFG